MMILKLRWMEVLSVLLQNFVEILRNDTWFDQHKQAPVCMRGETSGKIIVPMAKY